MMRMASASFPFCNSAIQQTKKRERWCLSKVCVHWHTENTLILHELYLSLRYCFLCLHPNYKNTINLHVFFARIQWYRNSGTKLFLSPCYNHTIETFFRTLTEYFSLLEKKQTNRNKQFEARKSSCQLNNIIQVHFIFVSVSHKQIHMRGSWLTQFVNSSVMKITKQAKRLKYAALIGP